MLVDKCCGWPVFVFGNSVGKLMGGDSAGRMLWVVVMLVDRYG